MDFNQFKDNYNDVMNESLKFSNLDIDYFTAVKAAYILSSAKKYNKLGTKVLDFGCGVGNYHKLLTNDFSDIYGVDTSIDCLNIAKKSNAFVNYAHYDGKTLPYEDDFFDLVYTVCVIHHIPKNQWLATLGELKRILKPNGLLMIFEHNPFNVGTRYVVNRCPLDSDAVLVKPYLLNKLIKKAGFSGIIETNYILTLPVKKFEFLNMLFHKIPLGAQYYKVIKK